MCYYCDLDNYTGELLPVNVVVDGSKQDYEVYLLDDIDYCQKSICIYGTYSELRIKTNYCPMCGREL